MRSTTIARRLILICAFSLNLGACGNLLGPPDAGQIYVVTPNFSPPATGGEKVKWALAILMPDTAAGLDTDRIALTQPDGTMDYYAKANYPDGLPAIVQQAVLNGFEKSGRIDAVARDQDGLHTDYDLVIEVKDFAAHYDVPDGIPKSTVSMVVKLTTARGHNLVGTFATTKSVDATVNSTGAAVKALREALGAAVSDIVNWTLAAPAPARQHAASP